ncbi:MAG: SurA N-terminal domain-containing protein [Candidatus Adiutrix sp.]|jgi:peptidyl-prolyl cis-trans isomerase D|nr:SurA N-terminal domain-containing protein [Candidatus Adiutrix sp.]
MLQYMRRNANSTVVWLIIGAIAVVFVFFGIGGSGGSSRMITVNGEEVPYIDYSRLVDELSRSGDYSEASAQAARIEAARQSVSRLLTFQFGRGVGLEPSDQAVARRIAESPDFQTDGRFDRELYLDILEANGLNPARYEADIRNSLLAERSAGLIVSLSKAYRPEVREAYHFESDQAEFDYAFFPSEVHRAGLAPTEAELGEYFTATLETWRKPATMKVQYVEIKPADFVAQAEVTPAELETFYQDNIQRFSFPESAEVSHILIRFPQLNPGQAEKDAALATAQAAYERAKTEDFAALATELSQDPGSAQRGGALGSISRGMTLANFEDAAFTAPVGEVTQPVETDLGYHVIKVTSRKEAGTQPLDEVREALTGEMKNFKARELAVAKLEDLIIRAETSKLAEAAASLGLTATASESFTAAEPPAFFSGDAAAVNKAFAAALGKTGDPVESETVLALYEPLERQESFIPALEDVKAEVTEAWITRQADRKARETASAFLAEAAAKGWSQALSEAAAKPESGHSGPAGRLQLASVAPFDTAEEAHFRATVFSVSKAGEISPIPMPGKLNGKPGAFAMTMTNFVPADEALLENELGEYLNFYMNQQKANLMYEVWQMELFELSKDNVVVPAEYLQ